MPPPSGSSGVVVTRWPRVDTASPPPSPTPAGAAAPAAKKSSTATAALAAAPAAAAGPVVPVQGHAQRGEAFQVIAAAVLNQTGQPFTQVVLELSLVPGSDAFKAFVAELRSAVRTVRDAERADKPFSVSLVVPDVLTQPTRPKRRSRRSKG